jgi:hypothetical protein
VDAKEQAVQADSHYQRLLLLLLPQAEAGVEAARVALTDLLQKQVWRRDFQGVATWCGESIQVVLQFFA